MTYFHICIALWWIVRVSSQWTALLGVHSKRTDCLADDLSCQRYKFVYGQVVLIVSCSHPWARRAMMKVRWKADYTRERLPFPAFNFTWACDLCLPSPCLCRALHPVHNAAVVTRTSPTASTTSNNGDLPQPAPHGAPWLASATNKCLRRVLMN